MVCMTCVMRVMLSWCRRHVAGAGRAGGAGLGASVCCV